MNSAFRKGARWRALVPVFPIIVGFATASLAFNVTVPLLEAPDETSHIAMLRFIGTNHALPVQRPPADFPAGQEGSQPPLYYLIAAALYQISPSPALAPTFPRQNPFVSFKRSVASTPNRNFYGHLPSEGFPFRGDVLGLHLARAVGLLMGGVTVLFTFLIAREIWPRATVAAAIAASLVAFNPEFAFISGVVNNDNAIAMAATVVLWCLIRWLMRGGSTGLAIGLGLGLASALLAKTDGILLIPLVVLVLGLDFVGGGKGQGMREIRHALIVALLTLVLSGWWFARNQAVYGDPLGYSAMLAANAAMIRRAPLGLVSAVGVLLDARGTFWGIFGWTNILYPAWVYRVTDALIMVAVAGLAIGLGRGMPRRARRFDGSSGGRQGRRQVATDEARTTIAVALLVIWPVMVFASLARWVQINDAADQWRLFFGAIAPVAILLAVGLDQVRLALLGLAGREGNRAPSPPTPSPSARERGLKPEAILKPLPPRLGEGVGDEGAPGRAKRGTSVWPAITLSLLGLAINAVVIRTVIVPAFYPNVVAASNVDPSTTVHFGSEIELVKATVRPARIQSGDSLEVDLEWRAIRPPTKDWSVSLGLIDDNGTALTRVQSWPEGGRAPTMAWRPGLVYLDRYVLTPTWTSADPRIATIWLNLYDASVLGGPSLPVSDGSGKPIGDGVVVGHVKLLPSDRFVLRPTVPLHASFGPSIQLLGYDSAIDSGKLQLTLYWRDLAPLSDDYTVFVHVAEPGGRVLAQHDGPPRGGSYPTTAWEPGEVIRDTHVVDLGKIPAGTYPVLVGVYQHASGVRLSVRLPDGSGVPHDALPLYDLNVTPAGA